jgi:pyrimidine deaminase RibD-like protein
MQTYPLRAGETPKEGAKAEAQATRRAQRRKTAFIMVKTLEYCTDDGQKF